MKTLWIAVALLALAGAPALAEPAREKLGGVWTSRLDMGPPLRGTLSLQRDADGWRGDIAGVQARAATPDLEFPDSGGRVRLRDASDPQSAWWIQPPGLPGMAYATPVRLTRARSGALSGEVRPLPQTFTMHLALTPQGEGFGAAFRNPEFNMNGGASRFAARIVGDRLLVGPPGGETVREIEILENGARLRAAWPPVPAPLEFTKSVAPPAGYLPRAPGPYAYTQPARLKDGWRTARAGAAGFDEAALSAFVQGIVDADPAGARPSLIHSVLVARRGALVLEEYFHGYDRDTPHDLRSAGKTLTSLLMGVAMRSGADIGPQTRIAEVIDGADASAKAGITLGHLMTHTSGLDCDDNNDESPGNEGAMQGQSAQPDWWRFARDLPAAHAPGQRYAYCTAGMNLVGAALRKATGQSVIDLFDSAVARPLDFGLYHWNLMPNGEGYLGGGVHMRPRDLAKIGQLYLDGGVWRGRRIVDRAWVETSTSAHVEINEQTTGMDAARFAAIATRGADGYAWHRYGVRIGERRVESFEASGNGGQYLIVVPENALVVVITGGNYGQGGIWTRWRDGIVGEKIIGALRE